MPDKEFKLKYKIRNRAAKVLKRVIAEASCSVIQNTAP